MADPFIAQVQMWANNFNPRGWAYCYGSLMNISQNTALFSLIGTTYGGDGRVSFGVPDFRGRAPMNWGTGPGLTPRYWGEFGGYTSIVLNELHMPSHNHGTLVGQKEPANSTEDTPGPTVVPARRKDSGSISYRAYAPYDAATSTSMSENITSVYGASQGHENRQPFLSVNFCIAMLGMYPSRN